MRDALAAPHPHLEAVGEEGLHGLRHEHVCVGLVATQETADVARLYAPSGSFLQPAKHESSGSTTITGVGSASCTTTTHAKTNSKTQGHAL